MSTEENGLVERVLIDERRLVSALAYSRGMDVLTVAQLIDYCEGRCRDAGLEVVRTNTPRRNEAGQQIGPDVGIDQTLIDIAFVASGAIERAREETVTAAIGQALAGGPVQREQTARFTWRDLMATNAYRRDLPELLDLTRADIFDLSASLGRRVDAAPGTGGLLMWNRTIDSEVGHLAMVTGQTAQQERQVLDNAGWLVSCGKVYSGSHIGWHRKGKPDTQFQLDPDNRMWVWLLPNDRDVDGMIR